jgi:hypothetical protein
MGTLLKLVCAVALGVVGVAVGIRNLNSPARADIPVVWMPFGFQVEIGSPDSTSNDRIVNPAPMIQNQGGVCRKVRPCYVSGAIGRNVGPTWRAFLLTNTKFHDPSGRSTNIFEFDANDLISLNAEFRWVSAIRTKNRPFSFDEGGAGLIRMDSGTSGIERRSNSGGHRDSAQGDTPSGNPCLLIGEDGHCVGGVRRTSLLYQVVCLQAVLLLGLLAGFGAFRAFPISKPFDLRWFAICAASAIAGQFFLVAGITGKVWLFGI